MTEKFNKILTEIEAIIEHIASFVDQDEIAKKRMSEIKANPSIAKSEKELDSYLRKRCIKVE